MSRLSNRDRRNRRTIDDLHAPKSRIALRRRIMAMLELILHHMVYIRRRNRGVRYGHIDNGKLPCDSALGIRRGRLRARARRGLLDRTIDRRRIRSRPACTLPPSHFGARGNRCADHRRIAVESGICTACGSNGRSEASIRNNRTAGGRTRRGKRARRRDTLTLHVHADTLGHRNRGCRSRSWAARRIL